MEAPNGDDIDYANRRASPRARTLKHAIIIMNGGHSTFDCVVRNISDGGAMLQIPAPFSVPSHFQLETDWRGAREPCTVRWRSDAALGVSFDNRLAA